jgi:hypothetical protein
VPLVPLVMLVTLVRPVPCGPTLVLLGVAGVESVSRMGWFKCGVCCWFGSPYLVANIGRKTVLKVSGFCWHDWGEGEWKVSKLSSFVLRR